MKAAATCSLNNNSVVQYEFSTCVTDEREEGKEVNVGAELGETLLFFSPVSSVKQECSYALHMLRVTEHVILSAEPRWSLLRQQAGCQIPDFLKFTQSKRG